MTINFTNSPIDGNTYDYQGIRYTYKDTGGGTGYWRVLTPGTVSIATVGEINTGINELKYITPSNFAASKYASVFDQGTKMLFRQSSAPTGWTKETTHDNKALRIVSGSVGDGGSVDFSTAFGRTSTDGHELSIEEIPSHQHATPTITRTSYDTTGGASGYGQDTPSGSGPSVATTYVGGGELHSHSIDLRVKYVDLIIATKD